MEPWALASDPEFQARLAWTERFVRDEVWPLETIAHELTREQLDNVIEDLRQRVRAEGMWAPHLPVEHGGQGLGQVQLALVHEQLGTSPLGPVVFGCHAPDAGNAELLVRAATAEQRERYLEPLASGTARSAFSMTEPETAGSDPTLLATRARRSGDEYVIEGRKWFTTNGSIASFLLVMAVTDPSAPRHRRASILIVDLPNPGVRITRDVPTMEDPEGAWGALGGHAEIEFTGARVPVTALLGSEGDGFELAQARLVPGRIHHCMRWLGVCRRAFDMLCERATYRESHGAVLGDHQAVQRWIADSAAEIHAARLMTLHAAWTIDAHGPQAASREVSQLKYFGARVLHDVVDRALQAHGALGYSTDLPLERMYRDARAARILDGPDEVHRQSVARSILREYVPPPNGLPTEHVPTRRAEARRRFAAALAT